MDCNGFWKCRMQRVAGLTVGKGGRKEKAYLVWRRRMEWGSRDFLKRNKRNKKSIRKKAVDLKGADASREALGLVSPHLEGTMKLRLRCTTRGIWCGSHYDGDLNDGYCCYLVVLFFILSESRRIILTNAKMKYSTKKKEKLVYTSLENHFHTEEISARDEIKIRVDGQRPEAWAVAAGVGDLL